MKRQRSQRSPMTGTTYVRSEARATETDDHHDFFTMVVPLNSRGMASARRPWRNQLVGSTSVSLGLSSGADGLLAGVFNDVCAGGRRPARRTATLSVRKLVWVNTSSGKSGHMTRSFLRRRLACFARALISSSGEVCGVARPGMIVGLLWSSRGVVVG